MATDPNLVLSPTTTRSIHDDSGIHPSSQDPSHDPCHTPSSQSSSVDKINVLQIDMATTKGQLDHLKESVDTKISKFQSNLESSLTVTIGNLDSKFASKISALESKMDSKFDNVNSKFDKIDTRFEILEKDLKHVMVELKAELGKQMAELYAEMGKHETRLVWRMFFIAVGITAIAVGGATTVFMRDRLLPQ